MTAVRPGGRSSMQTTNLADRYGLDPLTWSSITAGLAAGFPQAPRTGGPGRHTCWLTTLDTDGAPHVTGIGAQWRDGSFWFETGAGTRKGRNLARDPRCALAVATAGFDLTVSGTATPVDDPAVVAELAAAWNAGGWPCRPDETGVRLTADFSAPSAGAPPWHVYRLELTSAAAVATVEPGGATRWRF